jgi:hypothetical protein
MNDRQFTTVANQLEGALSEAELTRIGIETGFTQRLRSVTPTRLVLTLLGTMASRRVESIADLRRAFCAVTNRGVEYKPFHNQLAKQEFPVFMYGVFEHLLGQLVVKTLAAVPGHALRQFDDIVAHDGSSFGVHAALRSTFPGRFTTTSPAAVELHATLSILQGQALRVFIAPDAKAEREFLPEPKSLHRQLILADRGYMDLDYCARAAEAGASFIIRFSRSADPRIVGGTIDGRRVPKKMIGRELSDCTKWLKGHSADLEAEWIRVGGPLRLRLVMSWNDGTREHMRLGTNLARTDFTLEAVRCLYRLRWQIELLFKEWKSYANLKAFCTRKAPIAEGLIWAALCAAALKRFLAHAAQAVSSGIEVSTRNAAMSLGHHLPLLIHALLNARPIGVILNVILDFLRSACRRAHPARDRKRGRLASGLRPAFLSRSLATCVAKD